METLTRDQENTLLQRQLQRS